MVERVGRPGRRSRATAGCDGCVGASAGWTAAGRSWRRGVGASLRRSRCAGRRPGRRRRATAATVGGRSLAARPSTPRSTGRATMVASVATAMRTRSVASTLRVAVPWFTQVVGRGGAMRRRPLRPSKLGLRQPERNPGVAQRGQPRRPPWPRPTWPRRPRRRPPGRRPARCDGPGWGTGARYGASVSTRRRSSGQSTAAAAASRAALERHDAGEGQVGAEVEAAARLGGPAGEAVEDRARRARPRRRGRRRCRPTPRGCGSRAVRSRSWASAIWAANTSRCTSRGEWS